MSRFAHEAVAADPATGIVYGTEDSGNTFGFYRFLPNEPGNMAAGGRLEMLAVKGRPLAVVVFLTAVNLSGSPRPPKPLPASSNNPSVVNSTMSPT